MTTATLTKPDDKTMIEKGMKDARCFLSHCGYSILEELQGSLFTFVAEHDNQLVFVAFDVRFRESFPKVEISREEFEEFALGYITEHDEINNCCVRADSIAVILLGENKSFLRRHENIYATTLEG